MDWFVTGSLRPARALYRPGTGGNGVVIRRALSEPFANARIQASTIRFLRVFLYPNQFSAFLGEIGHQLFDPGDLFAGLAFSNPPSLLELRYLLKAAGLHADKATGKSLASALRLAVDSPSKVTPALIERR